ncbi:unnamed protein product, partial [Closterium sp. NIES-53]
HLLAAETSAVAVGVARGTPRPPFFEGWSPSPLAPSYASVAAADVSVAEDVGAASASVKRRTSKCKGGKGGEGGRGGGGGGSGSGGGASGGGRGGSGGGGGGGSGGASALVAVVGAAVGVAAVETVGLVAVGLALGVSVLGVASVSRSSVGHRCFSRLDDAWRAEFGDDAEIPRWADLLKSMIAIFDLNFDAILSTMYALSVSAEGDCYWTFLSCACTLKEVVSSPPPSWGLLSWGGHSPVVPFADSPRQNGIAERRIGLVMEVARTSMIHAAAPHFLWPFAVRYAAHQLNLWPPDKLSSRAIHCVFLGFVPNAHGWQFYHPTSRRVFPSQDVTFDESIPFYRLFPYRSAPSLPPPLFLAPDPLPGTAPVQVAIDSGAARGAASGGVDPEGAGSEGAETGGAEPGGVEPGGAEPGGVATGGGEPGGAEPEGVEPGGAALEGAESGGEELRGAASSGGSAGASPRLSPQQLREWFVWRTRLRSGASRARGAGAAGADVTGVTTTTTPGSARKRGTGAAGTGGVVGAGAGAPTEPGAAGAGGAGAAGVGTVDPGAGGPGDAVRSRPYFVPLLQQVLGLPSSTGLTPPLLCPPLDQSRLPLPPASSLLHPFPYTEQSSGLTERREPASCPVLLAPRPVSPVRTARRVPRSRPPPVLGTHAMALRPSSVPLRVPLPTPPESSLPEVHDPESDRTCAASPSVARLLATAVTDPSFEFAAASALVAGLLDFAAACRLDYASAIVAESVSASPPSVGGECAIGTDVLEDRQEDFESLAAAVPRFASMLLAFAGDPDAPDIPTPHSYAEAIMGFSQRQGVDYFQTFSPTPKMTTPRVLLHVAAQRDYELHSLDFSTAFLQGSLHEEIWLRRPLGFTESFPAGTQWSLRWPVYGLRQAPREWHDTVRTTLAALGFAPATADPSLFLRTDTLLPSFYVDDLVFATADTEALTLVKSELQKRHICTDLGELHSYLGLQITRDRARLTITVSLSHMVHQVLQRFGFQFSSPQPTPLSTSHSLSAPPLDESVELSGPYSELVGCLMYLMTCTQADLAYPLSLLARYVAPGRHQKLVLGGRGPVVLIDHADASLVDDSAKQRSSQGYTFSLGSGSVSWQSTRSSSVLSSSCEAEIYAGAMAAQELRWLTYLLTDLGEQPRSPPVWYVDNKAMIAFCREHRLEHRTKHIALRYLLARELHQHGQLRLAYVATRANTADVFTKAFPPGDHQ